MNQFVKSVALDCASTTVIANGMRIPGSAIGYLQPYFIGEDLTTIRLFNGIPWYVPSKRERTGFTRGEQIFIANGYYHPDTASGLALLGHEIEHVVQMRRIGRIRFAVRYFGEYLRGLKSGMNPQDAYLGISFEKIAFGLQKRIFEELSRSGLPR